MGPVKLPKKEEETPPVEAEPEQEAPSGGIDMSQL